jgi:hypothetical protein
MSQTAREKRPLLSRKARIIVALAIIAFFVVLSFFLPKEQDTSTIVGDTTRPAVTVTGAVSTLAVNRGADYNQIHFTVTRVTQATAFSDDLKRKGKYTIRVEMQAQVDKGNQAPIGINYPSVVRLVLPGGQEVVPKLIALAPAVLPGQVQDGYIDFPIDTRVDLSSLTLRLGSGTMLAFR